MKSTSADRRKTRLHLTPLEERQTPALHVSNLFGNLLITGTPDAQSNSPYAGWSEQTSVERVGTDQFRVTDGTVSLGTYSNVKNISLRLNEFDNNILIDLAGGKLKGNVSVDLGTGDSDPSSSNLVVIGGTGGQIGGSVTVNGTSSTESVFVGCDLIQESYQFEIGGVIYTNYVEYTVDTPLLVKTDIHVTGHAVNTPVEDYFVLGLETKVGRDVITKELSYVFINGEVKRDVTASVTESPGGMGMTLTGRVGRDMTATAEAMAPGYSSFVSNYGSIGRDLDIAVLAGESLIYLAPDNGTHASSIGRDVSITTCASSDSSASIFVESDIGRHLRIYDGDGDLFVRLGAHEIYVNPITGEVIFEYTMPFTVGGNVSIVAGNGNNTLFLPDAPDTSICGKLIYWGGSTGTDTLTIDSQSSIRLFAYLGDGDNTVTFAPTAKMGFALLVYKSDNGTTTITPPDVIDFPFFVIPL